MEAIFGFFDAVPTAAAIASGVLVLFVLGYTGAPLLVWAVAGAVLLVGVDAALWLWITYGVLVALLNVPPVRRAVLTAPIVATLDRLQFLPLISSTERTALEAGTVWVEGELFSGKPDFDRLMKEPYPDLSEEEQAFLDGPCREVCQMVDDWQVWQERALPEEVWDYLKAHKFFGLIVPREYGGLGYSALANSAVVQMLSARSQALGITVMVPNSLGPAELLAHYGTQAQKEKYLPELATGEILPAFALTEPQAGSDAGNIGSTADVFRGDDGEIYLRLNWRKRYITLAAISDLLGLAVKLRDPDNLLGQGEFPGITCVLVPTGADGVVLGRRHDPLGVPFYNCPTEGHDVVLPADAIIGGPAGAGQGWRMLTESLSAGRGISLPAGSTGGAKAVFRVASAHAAVRKQFGMPIGKFEGIEEPLARIGGLTYTLEGARRYTCGAIDQGAKPAVVTAIAKYNFTERFRGIINDGMDILGGNAISRGPRNLLAHAYIGTPISITVEGANILTRTLIIFGQGAIRCHPYAYGELAALMAKDVAAFDALFWKHIGHVVRNAFRAVGLFLTRGRLAGSPVGGPASKYWKKLAWVSAVFAFWSDVALGTLGGGLKRKERLTGRFADVFSWMYLAAATLRRWEADGQRPEDRPFFEWAMRHAFAEMQSAMDGIYLNLPVPGLRWALKGPVRWLHRLNGFGAPPPDWLGQKVAQLMQQPTEQRERMTAGLYVGAAPDPMGVLEHAFRLSTHANSVERKIKDAIRARTLPKAKPHTLLEEALAARVITEEEAEAVRAAEAARWEAIQVDDFTLDVYKATALPPAPDASGDGATAASKAPIPSA